MYTCDCGRTPPVDYEFCGCGQPVSRLDGLRPEMQPSASFRQGDNNGGIQAGRDITADKIVFGNDTSDPYALRIFIGRSSEKRSVLPDNWVTAAAGICTVVTFILTTVTSKHAGNGLWLLLPVIAIVSVTILGLSLYLRFGLEPGRVFVWPFGDRKATYEKSKDGLVYATLLEAECPWCSSNGCEEMMFVRSSENKLAWVCRANPSQHIVGFDPTSVAPIA